MNVAVVMVAMAVSAMIMTMVVAVIVVSGSNGGLGLCLPTIVRVAVSLFLPVFVSMHCPAWYSTRSGGPGEVSLPA